ncbi:MAG: bifunctional hydroxymethylpyrimidine kinase/phosphomethylpyrimidine kinase [Myxococcales bacterium]|nr:bifunctional hydroxymethylpyrimidine kinase/phosphomethylpyrimidine kinase [Myxococcales bacterium]
MRSHLLTVGLTPTWQRVLCFEALAVGAVNRTSRVLSCAAGKSVNAAVAAKRLGAARVTALCIVGGGADEQRFVYDVASEGVELCAVRGESELRTCTTLLEGDGRATELVQNAGPESTTTLEALRAQHERLVRDASLQLLCGSLPQGAPATLYRDLLAAAPDLPALVDARGEALAAALEREPLLVKPNRLELAESAGIDAADDDALERAMVDLSARGARWVLVSDGARPARLLERGGEVERVAPLAVDRVVNPIGSGDTLLAGIAVALGRGAPMRDAVTRGLEAAAANVVCELPGRI